MDFTVIRDFYGIDNTLYRLGSRVSVDESKLMDQKTGKAKPEIKHLRPVSKDAIAFIEKHLGVVEEKPAASIPEKVRAGRGRSVSDPYASNKTPKNDDGDSGAGVTIIGAPALETTEGPPVSSNLFGQDQ